MAASDLLVIDGTGKALVLLNLGGGVFAAPVANNIGPNFGGVAVGDFNGDGFPDIAVVNFGDYFDPAGQVCVLPGNGDGTFRAPVAGGCVSAPDDANVVVGDFNGDGKMDIAFTMEGDASLNPGAGDAISVFGKPVHSQARMSVALGTSAPNPGWPSRSAMATALYGLHKSMSPIPAGRIWRSPT